MDVRSGLGNPFGGDSAAKIGIYTESTRYRMKRSSQKGVSLDGSPLEIAKHHRVHNQRYQRETDEQGGKTKDLERGLQLTWIGIHQ